MVFTIFVDENGVELSRKERGRGRPPVGKKLENGDIIVTVSSSDNPIDIVAKKKPEIVVQQEQEQEDDVVTGPDTKIDFGPSEIELSSEVDKKHKNFYDIAPCVTPQEIIDGCTLNSIDVEYDIKKKYIILDRVYVRRHFGGKIEALGFLKFSSVLYRIILDINTATIKIWERPSSSPVGRINYRKSKGEFLSSDDLTQELERGDAYSDPADRVSQCLIIDRDYFI